MTDRIEKPVSGAAYQITPTRDAKDDNRQNKGQDESSFRRISDWERYFLKARQNQQSVQIPFGSVKEIRYQNAAIHKGAIIFHVDMVLTDGSFQTGCLLQHPRLDLFSKAQAKKPGELLPLDWFAEFDPLYVTLFSPDSGVGPGAGPGPDPSPEKSERVQLGFHLNPRLCIWAGILDPATGRYNFGLAAIYLTTGMMILAAGWMLIKFLLVKT